MQCSSSSRNNTQLEILSMATEIKRTPLMQGFAKSEQSVSFRFVFILDTGGWLAVIILKRQVQQQLKSTSWPFEIAWSAICCVPFADCVAQETVTDHQLHFEDYGQRSIVLSFQWSTCRFW